MKNEHQPPKVYECDGYNYRYLENCHCWWENTRVCGSCGERTLKHNKPLLKERDKWLSVEYGYVRTQSAFGNGKSRLDKYHKDNWEELIERDLKKYNTKSEDDLFCLINNLKDSDFSICKNDCKSIPILKDGSTSSFEFHKSYQDYINDIKHNWDKWK